ncbi:LLM class flavin-dependent oxidoreductase [Kitasatospora sp. NPDC002965]|uniref:LLM class flavin-dependent oxidoreductase n=1 Tax=Kitasatospora sp. NPDC002965 TaxID=3154775 RepID=UPI0033B2FB20
MSAGVAQAPRWSVAAPQGAGLELAGLGGSAAWRTVVETAALARDCGYHALWLEDRTDTLPRREAQPVVEAWTALGALAATLPGIRLGLLAAGPPHRNAVVLAKQAACADVISGGRLSLALTTAGPLPEHVAAGTVPGTALAAADPAADLVAHPGTDLAADPAPVLAETIEALRALWSGTRTDAPGPAVPLAGAHAVPVPVQPRLPLAVRVDAAAPDAAARLPEAAVRECAAVQWQGEPEQVAAAIRAFGRRREELGLAPEQVRHALVAEGRVFDDRVARDRWLSTPHVVVFWSHHPDLLARRSLYGTPDQLVERAARYTEAGVGEFLLWFRDYPATESLRRFAAEVAPRVPAPPAPVPVPVREG